MRKLKFYNMKPGETIQLPMRQGLCRWDIKCCDCGLEHSLLMQPKVRRLLVKVWRTDCLAQMILPKKHQHQKRKRFL